MKFGNKSLLLLIIVFVTLLASAWSATSSLKKNTQLLHEIESTQFRLSTLSSRLTKEIQRNQSIVLQALLMQDESYFQLIRQSADKIVNIINQINSCIASKKGTLPQETLRIIQTIQSRMIAYRNIEQSVLKAIKQQDEEETKDALVGFNATAAAFTNDILDLIDLTNSMLEHKLQTLQKINEKTSLFIYLSYFLSITLLIITTYLTLRYQQKMYTQLKRAERAEHETRLLKEQIERYNKELEHEIELKKREIYEKIYTNAISHLPNRNRLIEDIQNNDFKFLAILNIDNFQKFNDVYGEELGNTALRLSAKFLKNKLVDNARLYHIGGDEFVVAIETSHRISKDEFLELIKELLKEYRKHTFSDHKSSFVLSMTAGITFGGLQKMLAFADMALKNAKNKNIHLEIYQGKELEATHKEDIECHKKLLRALDEGRILPFFQPIVPVCDSDITPKYEALARLIDEEGNIMPPANFLRIAKQNRIYYRVTKAILTKALKSVEEHDIAVSVNLSMADITNPKTVSMIYELLSQFKFCDKVTFELLETEDFSDYKSVYDFCVKVKSYGVHLALDDFGSGYSNFSHIIHLPIDYIKIDASLISNITRDHSSRIMVEMIVALARKIHVRTIAEFVSSEDILMTIKELGVDYAQGFYIGKPESMEYYIQNPPRTPSCDEAQGGMYI